MTLPPPWLIAPDPQIRYWLAALAEIIARYERNG